MVSTTPEILSWLDRLTCCQEMDLNERRLQTDVYIEGFLMSLLRPSRLDGSPERLHGLQFWQNLPAKLLPWAGMVPSSGLLWILFETSDVPEPSTQL